ncbi:MAG: DUF1365 domain-containing protein [Steroidobacteraceae bacterium]
MSSEEDSLPAAHPALASAVYEGIVQHRRRSPHAHAFRYRLAMLYLDLEELDRVFRGRWLWSARRPALAQFRRKDFLGPPERPLSDAVRDCAELALGRRPSGPIRLLTHLRYAGYSFNPVSFYYCFDRDGTSLDCIVAEITNTPWRERHVYVLAAERGRIRGRSLEWSFAKAFHVSPFMAMERQYAWRLTPPAESLYVHMGVSNSSASEFDATLLLRRHPLDGRSLRRVLWRYPLMTGQVIVAIYWQALRLRLKRNPVHLHPRLDRGHP